MKQALDVINFSESTKVCSSGGSERELLEDNQYFSLEKLNFDGEYIGKGKSGAAYTLIEGEGYISCEGTELFKIVKGNSFYAPHEDNFIIHGKGVILKSTEKH